MASYPNQVPYPYNVPSFHFSSPALNSPPSEEEYQTQRWANWVKFIAVYIILKSLLTIIGNAISIAIGEEDVQIIEIRDEIIMMSIFNLLIAYIGYRAGVNKTTGSAKVYICALFLMILVDGIWLVVISGKIGEYACDMNNDLSQGDKEKCAQDIGGFIALAALGVYACMAFCVYTPVLCCVFKMHKFAKATQERTQFQMRQLGHPGTHFQSFPMNPVRGVPV